MPLNVPNITLTNGVNSIDIRPADYNYQAFIFHDWRTNRVGTKEIKIHDNGPSDDRYTCECVFQLSDSEAVDLIAFYTSMSRGEEFSLDCSNSGFFPFSPLRGNVIFDCKFLSKPVVGQRIFAGITPVAISIQHTGIFPAYSVPSQVDEGPVQIGGVSGLRCSAYSPDTTYNIVTNSNFNQTFINEIPGDKTNTIFTLQMNQSKCAALVGSLIAERSSQVTLSSTSTDEFFFGVSCAQGPFLAFRTNSILTITNDGHDSFNVDLEYQKVVT